MPGPAAAAPGVFGRGGLWASLLVVPLIALAVLWVYVDVGVPHTFDTSFHMLRIGMLDRHLHDGLFFPRWLPEMLLGYGYPLLNYYAPAIYYVAETWHLLGVSVYHSIILTSLTTTVVAGFGAWLLAYDLLRRRQSAALVAAAMYMLAPYLMINIFNRGAMGEAGAQAIFPWALWCAGRLFSEARPQRFAVGLMTVLALLATMHTITLFYAPAIVFFYLVFAWRAAHMADPAEARRRALWAAGAVLSALALSAFFWAPLLFERNFVSDRGFQIARDVMLESGIWRARNFLDLHLIYENVSARPVQIGLVQLALALLGLACGFGQGMRSDWRWWFWIAVSALFCLLLTRASLPIWENTLLSATQFPWRVLSMLSLPLALFAGAVLLPIRRQTPKILTTAALLGLIVFVQTPRIAEKATYAAASGRTDAAVLAMFDLDKGVLAGGENTSSIQEFRPVWAPDVIGAGQGDTTPAQPPNTADGSADASASPLAATAQVIPLAMNATGLTLSIDTTAASGTDAVPFSFTTFYFPGWRATLYNGVPLAPYPAAETGLLTVDLPAGVHTLALQWEGTALEKGASFVSLAAALLIGLALIFTLRSGWRGTGLLGIFWLLLALLALWGWLWQSPQTPVQLPVSGLHENGVRLLGATVHTEDAAVPTVTALWQVTATVDKTLLAYWQVQNAAGDVLGDAAMRPWYNTSSPAAWPVGAIVDDAYQLPVPSGLPAGDYQLAVATRTVDELDALDRSVPLPPQFVFTLTQPVPNDPQPQIPLRARVGEEIQLAGYTPHAATRTSQPGLSAVVRAGSQLRYSLFWRTPDSIYNQNHGFIHLIDHNGDVLVQRDQGPGPLAESPEVWLPNRTYEDVYQLYIPADAPSGIYTPIVGQYIFASEERLPVWISTDDTPAGESRLLPVKVLNPSPLTLSERLAPRPDARFGDFALLEGWRGIAGTQIDAGATYTVTLTWKSLATTTANYTRFLQVVNEANQIVAQSDGIPQNALNPTWSWIPDELIADTFPLTVREDAAPGQYRIIAGLYDTDTGARASAFRRDGAPWDADAVIVATVEVRP